MWVLGVIQDSPEHHLTHSPSFFILIQLNPWFSSIVKGTFLFTLSIILKRANLWENMAQSQGPLNIWQQSTTHPELSPEIRHRSLGAVCLPRVLCSRLSRRFYLQVIGPQFKQPWTNTTPWCFRSLCSSKRKWYGFQERKLCMSLYSQYLSKTNQTSGIWL